METAETVWDAESHRDDRKDNGAPSNIDKCCDKLDMKHGCLGAQSIPVQKATKKRIERKMKEMINCWEEKAVQWVKESQQGHDLRDFKM